MAYSNKALPPGTVLREWRLEQVLGVGGFGIVYKGRGIYFDELVAIKEYFPSAISERDSDDTVVPTDSDSEEVHALGLKKFVEEAKLLWNLSTPSRHPNIVSVRSLFEIHGTAYMVMDFEDGVSLSEILKSGKKFNEASLMALIKPIAEGLERAHRVGVLHRDIKPPNMLVSEDGRPVLIDFGSARFDSGQATSTSVTFHTPPYAALEQYVKTYEQGPWTDIYALGVVLYECVTGAKPPEVLERMHGEGSKPLAGQEWEGFSQQFLHGIDAAMTVKPTERPRTIHEWLEMFEPGYEPPAEPAPVVDDEATRVAAFTDLPREIEPVAPPTPKPEPETTQAEPPLPDEEAEPPIPEPLAAKVAAEPKRARLRPVPILVGVAVLALLAGGAYVLTSRSGSGDPASDAGSDWIPALTEGTAPLDAEPEPDAALDAETQADPSKAPPTATAKGDVTKAREVRASQAAASPTKATETASSSASASAPSQAEAAPAAADFNLAAKTAEFKRIQESAKSIARDVVRLGRRDRPDSSATDAQKKAWSVRQKNADQAKSYEDNINRLSASLRGAKSDSAAQAIISQATTVRGYLATLKADSEASLNQ